MNQCSKWVSKSVLSSSASGNVPHCKPVNKTVNILLHNNSNEKSILFYVKNCVKVILCIFRLRNLHVWNSRVWLSQPFSSIKSVSFQSSIAYWQIFQYCQNLSFFKEHVSSIIKLFILLGPSLLMLKPVDLKCIELSLFGHCRSINDLILIVQISL